MNLIIVGIVIYLSPTFRDWLFVIRWAVILATLPAATFYYFVVGRPLAQIILETVISIFLLIAFSLAGSAIRWWWERRRARNAGQRFDRPVS